VMHAQAHGGRLETVMFEAVEATAISAKPCRTV